MNQINKFNRNLSIGSRICRDMFDNDIVQYQGRYTSVLKSTDGTNSSSENKNEKRFTIEYRCS